MSACLRLESFSARPRRDPALLEPAITPADLEATRAAGFEEGQIAACDADQRRLTETFGTIAIALSQDADRRIAEAVQWRATTARLLQAVIAQIAPRTRSAALVEAILQELASLSLVVPSPVLRVACSAQTADRLRPAIDAAGLREIEIEIADGCPTIRTEAGMLVFDVDGLADRLGDLVDELMMRGDDGQD